MITLMMLFMLLVVFSIDWIQFECYLPVCALTISDAVLTTALVVVVIVLSVEKAFEEDAFAVALVAGVVVV